MHRPNRRLLALVAGVCAVVVALPMAASAHVGPDHRAQDQQGQGHGARYRQIGYFTQWGIYGRDFVAQDLVTSGAAAQLTHLDYAFSNVDATGRCASGDPWADYQRPFPAADNVSGQDEFYGQQPVLGNLNQLRLLKERYPGLSVLVSLGGWSWSKYFSDAALTEASRQAFVSSCIDLWLKGNIPSDGTYGGEGVAAGIFDGIDLDWEWPGSAGNEGNVIRPEDKRNFTLLLAEFRRQLDGYGRQRHQHFELSAFLPANPAAIDAGFEGRRIFRYLDFATVQGYDYHGTWESVTNHQSALFPPKGEPQQPDFTADRAIDTWLDRGAPAGELVLGIPYYGHGWTGVTAGGNGLFQPASGAAPATWEAGTEDYKVLAGLTSGGYTLYHDRRSGSAWLFNGETFWTLDDPWVIRQKAAFIRDRHLGGAMVWSLDGDDSQATLSKTIHAALR